MEKDLTYYRQLLAGYLLNLTDKAQLKELLAFAAEDPAAFDRLLQDEAVKELAAGIAEHTDVPEAVSKRMRQKLLGAIAERQDEKAGQPKSRLLPLWIKYAAAASIVLLAGLGGFYLLRSGHPRPMQAAVTEKIDVAPGRQGAVLTLSDGRKVLIDSAGHTVIPRQGASSVTLSKGAVEYAVNAGQPAATVYNTITTAYGRQFQLVLPDGTHVWLNSGSSLRYPTAFNGKERTVELTGEGYFDVVHNSRQPFRVTVNGHTVRDIGTAFNINAYSDEAAIRTTLVTGAIQIGGTLLKPGQEAVIGSTGIKVRQADIEQALAWKSGLFNFDGADLPTVLRVLARWYNLKVRYEGEVPVRHFGGELSMDLNLSEVLGFLEKLHVDFRMENGTLVVSGAKEYD